MKQRDISVAEKNMLHWMRGKTRQDNIRNDNIREREVAYKIVETRYRWFQRVKRAN
jgi:hypothetical protein